jgi:hypothetical protein
MNKLLSYVYPISEWWYHFCQEEKARVVQTILFVTGINTLFQTFFGTRLPVVMGASYVFVAPTISIILAGRYSNETDPRTVRYSPNSLFRSSLLFFLLACFWRNTDKRILLLWRDSYWQWGEHRVLSSSRQRFRWYLVSAGSGAMYLGWYDLFSMPTVW